jgi:CBS-domain-containing membrane protein
MRLRTGRPAARAGLGAATLIAFLALIDAQTGHRLLIGPLSGSCILVFGYPDLEFSRPRNVVFGHCIGSLIGLACLLLLGRAGWVMGLAVGITVAVMMLTNTAHPPAGTNPIIVLATQPAWDGLAMATATGAVLVVAAAAVFHQLTGAGDYPGRW